MEIAGGTALCGPSEAPNITRGVRVSRRRLTGPLVVAIVFALLSFGQVPIAAAQAVDPEASSAGDVDCDGSLGVVDALIIAGIVTGSRQADPDCGSGDADGDGTVSVIDALRVAQCSVGLFNNVCPEVFERFRSLLIGDSSYLEMAFGYTDPQMVERMELRSAVEIGCGTLRDENFDFCADRVTKWTDGLNNNQPDLVIMALSSWDVIDQTIDGQVLEYGSPEYEAHVADVWEQNLQLLSSQGAPVAVLSLPCLTYDPSSLAAPERIDPERTARINELVQAAVAASEVDAHWIDLRTLTCPDGEYQEEVNGVPLHRDGVHFSPWAVPMLWRWLVPRLSPLV